MSDNMDDIEERARAFLGTKQESIPQDVYDQSLARLIFVTKQWRRGLIKRDGHWRKPRPEDKLEEGPKTL